MHVVYIKVDVCGYVFILHDACGQDATALVFLVLAKTMTMLITVP